MIDLVDRKLASWIRSIVGETEVVLGAPRIDGGPQGVCLYLMEIINTPPSRTERPPLQITLRYLVTVWTGAPESEHDILGKLIFAALENREIEVEQEPLPPHLWIAFGMAPRPSFTIRVPCRRERDWKVAPPVRFAPTLEYTRLRSMTGRVVGPESIPLSGVRVEMPEFHLTTRTDSTGFFLFAGIPVEPAEKWVELRVNDSVMRQKVRIPNDQPLEIQLQEKEGVLLWPLPT